MLHCLSAIESDQNRLANWNQVQRGSMFDTGRSDSFIAVEKTTDLLRAVQLTPENIEKLLTGQEYEVREFHFCDIHILNLQDGGIWGRASLSSVDLELPKTSIIDEVLDLSAMALARMELPSFYEVYYDNVEERDVECIDDFFDQTTQSVVRELFENPEALAQALESLKAKISWFSNNEVSLVELDQKEWPGIPLEGNDSARYLAVKRGEQALYFVFSNETNPFQPGQ
ncbi:MAG: hypothetical protein KDD62_04515 [Bdellovibrionales bacterium]|nr:hypothetical protein [Bdellovibrionales bacterium]